VQDEEPEKCLEKYTDGGILNITIKNVHHRHPHPSSTTIQPGEVHSPATPGCVRFGGFVAPIGEPKNPELVPTPMREKR